MLTSTALVALMLGLPCLHYSRSHVHIVYGRVVVHYHTTTTFGSESSSGSGDKPVAGHTHSLQNLLNLWNIDRTEGIPEYQPVPIFCYVESELLLTEHAVPEIPYLRSPSARSPPAA